jgi:hypothetical protein
LQIVGIGNAFGEKWSQRTTEGTERKTLVFEPMSKVIFISWKAHTPLSKSAEDILPNP